ncbi:MAG: glucokinase [Ktedonobacteraceae bacterium]|nr:glucokinase [Ktedonobacteraceae bacterium]
MLLAGDIGGTKTNLALFAKLNDLHEPALEATFPSAQYPSLEALIQEFLANVKTPVDRAVFGVAGPVLQGKAKITNLPWVMDEAELQKALQIPVVHLLNDLAAIAHAIPLLDPGDLQTLNHGKAVSGETLAVIAPGTGLGQAFLTWDGSSYRTHPSEGGHADFAPTNPAEMELLRYMLKRFEHVSYEQVCSGIGLPNIYACLKDSALFDEPAWLREQLARAKDETPIIVNAALSKDAPPICINTLNIFSSILGAEAGNLVLKTLATGGVYIAGGIPPRILSFLQQERFITAFKNKGRFAKMLADVPIHVVLNPKIALMGAAAHGFRL